MPRLISNKKIPADKSGGAQMELINVEKKVYVQKVTSALQLLLSISTKRLPTNIYFFKNFSLNTIFACNISQKKT
jgi:hypothetical protein